MKKAFILSFSFLAFTYYLVDHFLPTREHLLINHCVLNGDAEIKVSVDIIKIGIFISFGHAYSIGDNRKRYNLRLFYKNAENEWEGSGAPIMIGCSNGVIFLATFDTETDFSQSDFVCYKFEGAWKRIATKEFPKHLTHQINLLNFDPLCDSQSTSSFNEMMLARFWYCHEHSVPYWKIENFVIPEDFIAGYRKSPLEKM